MEHEVARWTADAGWIQALPVGMDGPRTLVIALSGAQAEELLAPLAELASAFSQSVIIGCSTAGEFVGSTVHDDGLTVTFARFADSSLALEVAPVTGGDSRDAGLTLGKNLFQRGPELAGVIVLSDGTLVNGSALAEGLSEGTNNQAPVVGGLAGDGDRFANTWVVVDGEPRRGFVTAVGLYGSRVQVGSSAQGGWTQLGVERTVTKSVDNVLFEVDGQPALDLYKEYLGSRASGLPAAALLFPLSVRRPGLRGAEMVRTILGIDEDAKSMTFAGDIPAGSSVTLLRSTTERLCDAALNAGELASDGDAGDGLVLAVSCVGRRLYIGQRVDEELGALLEGVGETSHVVGFYSYGELSPAGDRTCDLYNQTMSVTVIRERTP